jgi:formylglycine-generating enzyme required for sulfatase activity
MKCNKCGFENKEEAKFCIKCGNLLKVTAKQTKKSKPWLIIIVILSLLAIVTIIMLNVSKKADLVFVKGGSFKMGSTSGDDDEKPVHNVTLRSFYISKYEVTQGEYEVVMGNNPSKGSGVGDNYPIYYVSWYDAVEFCNKLSDRAGLARCYSGSADDIKCDFSANGYRLPTEAEWEYAAKGGTKSRGYTYSGSNTITKVAEYSGNNAKSTKPVGGKQANELGIYDMSGNVWEWCWDWKGDYSSGAQNNPRGAASGSYRVNRGGSWLINARGCRVAFRVNSSPGFSNYYLGFRLACSSK